MSYSMMLAKTASSTIYQPMQESSKRAGKKHGKPLLRKVLLLVLQVLLKGQLHSLVEKDEGGMTFAYKDS